MASKKKPGPKRTTGAPRQPVKISSDFVKREQFLFCSKDDKVRAEIIPNPEGDWGLHITTGSWETVEDAKFVARFLLIALLDGDNFVKDFEDMDPEIFDLLDLQSSPKLVTLDEDLPELTPDDLELLETRYEKNGSKSKKKPKTKKKN